MSSVEKLDDFTVVFTENQTSGRGQLGSEWQANPGENLTFSLFLDTSFLTLQQQFYLNCAVSISVFNVLKKLFLPNLKIKWPNDILSQQKKISGILIENVIKSATTTYSVIGIGLNVNQTEFNPSFKATSLKNILGVHSSLEELLILIVAELQIQVTKLRIEKFEDLHLAYEAELFRKNKPSTFKNAEGLMFSGFIKSVTSFGKLKVLLEDEVIKEFQLKEVKLLY